MDNWPEAGKQLRTLIPGPAGNLEILVEQPKQTSRGLMLICHPHPQFGGTMDNKVVYSLARSALGNDMTAVRFNFRGVGKSEGHHDEGVGELEDAASVLAMAREYSPGKLVLGGFSFGSAIALRLSERVIPDAILSIAPPMRYFSQDSVPRPACPWLIVHGDEDDVVECDETLDSLRDWSLQPKIEIIHGAGHFFHGQLTELRQKVDVFLRTLT